MSEVGILTAFVFGAVSFVSPCVLPLMPGYLSLMSGYSVRQLQAGQGSVRRMLGVTLLFVAGFTMVFVSLGAAATGLGQLLRRNLPAITTFAGWVVLLFGVLMVVAALRTSLWGSTLLRERRLDVRPSRLGGFAPAVMGLAFGFAWTPCIGPVLAAILAIAAVQQSVVQGMALLLAFSLGLAVPFVAAALGMTRAFRAGLGRYLQPIHVASGVLLAGFGILMITGRTVVIASWLQRLFTWLGLEWLASI
ncbi:MAG: cytochrome c biogenesis CcdA family protein [Acidimicrobiia bacterium]